MTYVEFRTQDGLWEPAHGYGIVLMTAQAHWCTHTVMLCTHQHTFYPDVHSATVWLEHQVHMGDAGNVGRTQKKERERATDSLLL